LAASITKIPINGFTGRHRASRLLLGVLHALAGATYLSTELFLVLQVPQHTYIHTYLPTSSSCLELTRPPPPCPPSGGYSARELTRVVILGRKATSKGGYECQVRPTKTLEIRLGGRAAEKLILPLES
jgi:hypothetical protein